MSADHTSQDSGLFSCPDCGASQPESGQCGRCPSTVVASTPRSTADVQDEIIESCIAGMGEFSVEQLAAVAEHAEKIKTDGWLPLMIREYLNVWREHGERP